MKGRVWRLFAWLFRIRTRLLLVNVLVVAVPLLGVGFARFYEREMLRGLEEDMIHQAELVKQVVLHDPSGLRLDAHEGLLRAAAKRTRTRIRLLGPAGEVISDSHAKGPPEGPEPPPPSYVTRTQDTRWGTVGEPKLVDVSHRSEVMAALSGSYGASARFWENRSVLYLFSAVPIEQKGVVSGVVYVTRSTNPVRSAMYRLRTQLLYILAGSVAVTVVLSLFLAATISRPLSRLTERAKRVAKGEKGVTLALARRDEIGDLARAFDTMQERLADRARSAAGLAADISHEFKTPLTGIRGAAELLCEGAGDKPDARAKFLRNILADSARLDRLDRKSVV